MVRATKRRCFSRYEWFIPKIMLMFPSIKGVDWNTKWAVIVVNLRIQCCKFFTKHKFSPWRYSYYIVRNYYALVVLKYHIYLVICSYNLSLNIELQFCINLDFLYFLKTDFGQIEIFRFLENDWNRLREFLKEGK